MAAVRSAAVISDDGLYRYRLEREWSTDRPMTFVMLNPSTADAELDDPTIRRCMGFARREGCGGIVVVNLFALRVTRPVHLVDETIGEPNGPDNTEHVDRAIAEAAFTSSPIVCAWGAFSFPHRSEAYREFFDWELVTADLRCLGETANGSPRHPLYVRADAPLVPWPVGRDSAPPATQGSEPDGALLNEG